MPFFRCCKLLNSKTDYKSWEFISLTIKRLEFGIIVCLTKTTIDYLRNGILDYQTNFRTLDKE